MFKKVGPNSAKNEAGVYVSVETRDFLKYKTTQRTLTIPREYRSGPVNFVVYSGRIAKWDSPFDDEQISLEEKNEIKKDIQDAIAVMGYSFYFSE